jgi:hypothetical protein
MTARVAPRKRAPRSKRRAGHCSRQSYDTWCVSEQDKLELTLDGLEGRTARRGYAQPCRHPQSQDDFIQIEIGMGGNEWACSNKQRICPFPGLDLGLTTQKDRRVWSGKGR